MAPCSTFPARLSFSLNPLLHRWSKVFRRQNSTQNPSASTNNLNGNSNGGNNGNNQNNGDGKNNSSGSNADANDDKNGNANKGGNNSSGQSSNSGGSGNNNGSSSTSTTQSKSSTPSGGTPANTTQPGFCLSCFIADNDPQLVYQGPWSITLSSFVTMHQTTAPGATVQLQFNGTSITVFGTIPRSNATFVPPTASYTIDAQPPIVTTQPTAGQDFAFQRLFFARDLSPDQEHTITIKVIDTGTPYTLQSFFIPPANPTNSSTPVTKIFPPPTVNATSSTGLPTSSSTDAPSSAGLPSPAVTQGSASNTIKILAGTLGCVLGIILILCAFFLWKFKLKKGTKAKSRIEDHDSQSSTSRFRASQFTSSESILRSVPSALYMPYTGRDIRRGSVVDYYLSFPSDGRHSPVPPVPPKF